MHECIMGGETGEGSSHTPVSRPLRPRVQGAAKEPEAQWGAQTIKYTCEITESQAVAPGAAGAMLTGVISTETETQESRARARVCTRAHVCKHACAC